MVNATLTVNLLRYIWIFWRVGFKLQLHLSECFSNFRQGGMTGGAALRKEIYLAAPTSGPIPDYLLQLYVPRPSQGRGIPVLPLMIIISGDIFPVHIEKLKRVSTVTSCCGNWIIQTFQEDIFHFLDSKSKKILFSFSSHLLHIKFLNLQRNRWSVTYLSQHGLATWIYPAKIELLWSISITWGKLLITGNISQEVILLTVNLCEVLEIPDPAVKLMFSIV